LLFLGIPPGRWRDVSAPNLQPGAGRAAVHAADAGGDAILRPAGLIRPSASCRLKPIGDLEN
jgi:hypothetical protein